MLRQPNARSISHTVALVALITFAAIVAACSAPAASPSVPPVSQPPVASPSAPGDGGDGTGTYVELETRGGQTPRALVKDLTDSLAGAATGHPAEGVSVGWDEVRVESIDDDSIRLTWSDYPIANEYAVMIAIDEDGRFGIQVVRPAPTTDTDTIALDRVLVLDFHVAVPLSDIDAGVQPSLGTGTS